MPRSRFILLILMAFAVAAFSAACGINSVTKAQLEAVKPGNVLTYRYYKSGQSWFYCDKITRIEGDKVHYNPGKNESTKGTDGRIREFETSKELSVTKDELYKFETEQGEEQKKIIWIE
jgi:hypothetical protein